MYGNLEQPKIKSNVKVQYETVLKLIYIKIFGGNTIGLKTMWIQTTNMKYMLRLLVLTSCN